jgi:uncharacterized Fe-S cluster protein YjdI
MSEVTKEYNNGDITVVWKPGQCIHSKICWTNLSSVFDPRKRPWVNIEGAETDAIMAQVEKCPSGALSFYRNTTEQTETADVNVDTVIEVMENGPLLIYGNITVKKKDGTEEKKNRTTALCRCGASSNKPYCDGAHVKIGFKDE